MSVKDFKPGDPDFKPDPSDHGDTDDQMADTGYYQEINTLKIDKLSNKVTIISVIIPVMIGAIIIFAYMDMKERVVDVDQTKQSQVEEISKQLEEKLNALDVKIAKNRFDVETTLPELKKTATALDGKLAKLTSTTDTDKERLTGQISTLSQQIETNTKNNQTAKESITQLKTQTDSMLQRNQGLFEKTAQQMTNELTLFKEEFDARLLELSDYEQQIGILRKDLSLLDKQYRRLEQDHLSKTAHEKQYQALQQELRTRLDQLKTSFLQDTAQLSEQIEDLSKSVSALKTETKTPPDPDLPAKPAPQVNIEPNPQETIKRQPLTQ